MTTAAADRAFSRSTQHQLSLCRAKGHSPLKGQPILRGMVQSRDFWCPAPTPFRRFDAACTARTALRRQETFA